MYAAAQEIIIVNDNNEIIKNGECKREGKKNKINEINKKYLNSKRRTDAVKTVIIESHARR